MKPLMIMLALTATVVMADSTPRENLMNTDSVEKAIEELPVGDVDAIHNQDARGV
jgi:hypothetical protein